MTGWIYTGFSGIGRRMYSFGNMTINMNKKQIILIVDDEETNRAILAQLFKDEYSILEAENGEEAIRLIEDNLEDVSAVLLDILMPVMDGLQAMEIMNSHYWIDKIPVIMITTDTSESTMQKGYELGATDVILKPFNSRIVRQRVKNIIELYRHKKNLERLASEQIDILRSKSMQVSESGIEIVNMLSRIITLKSGQAAARPQVIRHVAAAIMREYSHLYPELHIDGTRIRNTAYAASVCNIGKIFVPSEILFKNGPLTDEEYRVVQRYPAGGSDLLMKISEGKYDGGLLECCFTVCLYHNERADGTGYPYGLKEKDIPLEAQIVSIASVYEALVSDRPYRKAFSHDEAVKMIRNGECGCFGEKIIKAFMAAEPILTDEYDEEEEYFRGSRVSYSISEDVSERRLRMLEREKEHFQILSDMSGDVMFDYDGITNVLLFSESFSELTGCGVRYENALDFINETETLYIDDKERLIGLIKSITDTSPSIKTEIRIKMKNDVYKWFELYAHSVWNGGRCVSMVGKLVNIDRQKRETEIWRKAADTDQLTGIYNKIASHNYIMEAIETNGDNVSALCFIDLDNFKGINDTFGHQFGDVVLKKVAEQLRTAVRNTDIVGRIGGDEFVVFLKNVGSKKNIIAKAEQLCNVFKLTCGERKISGSIGIACIPDDGTDFEELLGKADSALYCCKGRGKDCYLLYNEEICGKINSSSQTGETVNV